MLGLNSTYIKLLIKQIPVLHWRGISAVLLLLVLVSDRFRRRL